MSDYKNPEGLNSGYGVELTDDDNPESRNISRAEKHTDGETILRNLPVDLAHKIVDLLRQASLWGFIDGRRAERQSIAQDIQSMLAKRHRD